MSNTNFSNAYQNFIPEIWSRRLQAMLFTDTVMMQCVNRNYEGEIKNAGDTVNILAAGEVAVNSLHGDTISYDEIAPSKQQLVIDQKKFFAFKINDVASAQSGVDIMEAHLANAKKAIEVDQDSYLLSLYTEADEQNVRGSSDEAVVLTPDNVYGEFVELAKILKNANAVSLGSNPVNPIGASKCANPWVVINPDVEAILLQSQQFTSSFQIAEKTVRDGAIGRIAGMDVLVSTNLKADAKGAIPLLAGTNAAITFASQVAKIEKIRDINTFSDLVRGLYLYGAKVVQPAALAVNYVKIA